MLLATVSAARAETIFDLCNNGDTKMDVVAIEDYEGPLGMFSPRVRELSGWYAAEPGKCARLIDDLGHSIYHFQILRYDAAGNFGYDELPHRQGDDGQLDIEPTSRSACVPAEGSFERRASWEALAACPSGPSLHIKMAFSVQSTSSVNLHSKLNFEPLRAAPLDVIVQAAAPKIVLQRGWFPPAVEVTRAPGQAWKRSSGEDIAASLAETVIPASTAYKGTDAQASLQETSLIRGALAVQPQRCDMWSDISNQISTGLPPFLYLTTHVAGRPPYGSGAKEFTTYASLARLDPESVMHATMLGCSVIVFRCRPKYGQCILVDEHGTLTAARDLSVMLTDGADPDRVVGAFQDLIRNSAE